MAPRVRWLPPYRSLFSSRLQSTSHSHTKPLQGALQASCSPDHALPAPPKAVERRPLRHLPLSTHVRTLLNTQITTTPLLQQPAVRIIAAIASRPFLSPDRNPLTRRVLHATVFRHFCAGETTAEVTQTISHIRAQGVGGVLLGWAHEIDHGGACEGKVCVDASAADNSAAPIETWREGSARTIEMVPPGQFAAIKLSGVGPRVLECLAAEQPPPPAMEMALDALCKQALAKGVNLVIDAEQTAVQAGIDAWTLDLQRKHNALDHGSSKQMEGQIPAQEREAPAIVYGTYQAYLRDTPATLSAHLRTAGREGFVLGAKLVRGAYLGSDTRKRMWDTKAETDRAYDAMAAALLRRRYDAALDRPPASPGTLTAGTFPEIRLIVATHNLASVQRARTVQREQRRLGQRPVPAVYAQLQGMADHVTGELLADAGGPVGAEGGERRGGEHEKAERENNVAKYMVWGTIGECTSYFVRRAEENRDAVLRSGEARQALWRELWRRVLRQ